MPPPPSPHIITQLVWRKSCVSGSSRCVDEPPLVVGSGGQPDFQPPKTVSNSCTPSNTLPQPQLVHEAERNALAKARIGLLGTFSEAHLAFQLLVVANPVSGRSDRDRATAEEAALASMARLDELVSAARVAMEAAHQCAAPAATAGPAAAAAGASSSTPSSVPPSRPSRSGSGSGSESQPPQAGVAQAEAAVPAPTQLRFGCCLPASDIPRR